MDILPSILSFQLFIIFIFLFNVLLCMNTHFFLYNAFKQWNLLFYECHNAGVGCYVAAFRNLNDQGFRPCRTIKDFVYKSHRLFVIMKSRVLSRASRLSRNVGFSCTSFSASTKSCKTRFSSAHRFSAIMTAQKMLPISCESPL